MALSAILGDEVEITLGGATVVLRPTLRAGVAVLNLHGNYGQTLKALVDVDTWTIQTLVERCGDVSAQRQLQEAHLSEIFALVEPLVDYVLVLSNGGVKPTTAEFDEDAQVTAGALSHEEYLARLFKLGTGWMGWTADQTLDATMPAIVSAYIGRQDMLRAIFGGGEKSGRNNAPLHEKVEACMALFGTRKVKRT